MSLLSYSSWTNDNVDRSNNISKKRTPTMGGIPRKTVKVRPNYDSFTDTYEQYTPSENSTDTRITQSPESVEHHIENQTEKTDKINSILNKITSFSADDKLGDFNPMPYPTNVTKRQTDQVPPAEGPVDNGENPLMPKTGKPTYEPHPPLLPKPIYYRASEPGNGGMASQYANYRDAYGKEGLTGQKEPYYAKMGISGASSGDKVMDRLNYMTQMLEALQMEKTNHVTEEFVLYSLLGVFMIYIVDGFSRGGKYIR